MSELLVLEELTLQGPDRVLVEGVSLTLTRGHVTALVGPSGSGKSLSARAAMGVIDVRPGLLRGSLWLPEHRSGDLFAGVAEGGERAHRRLFEDLGPLRGRALTYAPQGAASALNPGRTVGWQLAMALRRRSAPPADPARAIEGLLERVDLTPDVARALPSELSGGMAQRVALAVALAPSPAIVIADEPEAGLDPITRHTIVELLEHVARDEEVALWLISHSTEIVARMAATVVDLGAR
ncbi:MAG: ATP-binding cassette domain-containing protein [Myxococcota bacterium]